MTAAELNLVFAREVSGYPDSFWAGDYMDNGSAQLLPDYTKDWNAVIAEIEKRGLNWDKGPIEGHECFQVSCSAHVSIQPGNCEGLARAVLDCVRAMEGR